LLTNEIEKLLNQQLVDDLAAIDVEAKADKAERDQQDADNTKRLENEKRDARLQTINAFGKLLGAASDLAEAFGLENKGLLILEIQFLFHHESYWSDVALPYL